MTEEQFDLFLLRTLEAGFGREKVAALVSAPLNEVYAAHAAEEYGVPYNPDFDVYDVIHRVATKQACSRAHWRRVREGLLDAMDVTKEASVTDKALDLGRKFLGTNVGKGVAIGTGVAVPGYAAGRALLGDAEDTANRVGTRAALGIGAATALGSGAGSYLGR